eukprot:c46427_g1_i1.p1 GENE.c46427_g1_i1~~c46427_g1_i1.p1  ORF type:complete len:213 (+),score=37.08 c46427_g1_i1:663-1301(+)
MLQGDSVGAGFASRCCYAEFVLQGDEGSRELAMQLGNLAFRMGLSEQAWRNNDPEAHDCAGFLKYTGLGCAKNLEQAVRHFEIGAEMNNPDALCKLGYVCHHRQHFNNSKNTIPTAFELFRRSASLGHPVGQRNLGNMHEFGQGTPVNKAEALVWYRKAAAQDNIDAMCDLARLCRQGYEPGGHVVSMAWLQKAASRGSRDAIAELRIFENR